MKYSIKLVSTLLVLSLPITVQAACDRYPNSALGLALPATITVPQSLPVGGIIIRRAFTETAPAFTIYCATATPRTFTGRYTTSVQVPGAGVLAHPTNVPGVGVRVMVRNSNGLIYPHSLISTSGVDPGGTTHYSNVSAEAIFYKIGPVTNETLYAGNLLYDRWGFQEGYFSLGLSNSARFVTPAATCDLAAGDANRTITLPAIQTSALKDAVYAGEHNFELTANCTNASNVTFRFSGQPAVTDPWRFANNGTAGGASLWLYSRINGVKQTIRADGTDSVRTVVVSGNRSVLPLGAAYFKNGTVSQGTLISSATVNITYN